METLLAQRRSEYADIIFLSFPGDEKALGGCLASGRGFFHIGPDGSAEPCPFSPFSDSNVAEMGVREALKSPPPLVPQDSCCQGTRMGAYRRMYVV